MEASEVLFSIFGLHVTAEVTTTWGIMLVLVIFSLIATRNLKERPGKLQNAVELMVLTLNKFISGTLGEEKTSRYYSFFATLFIYIIVGNLCGLIPGAGYFRGFKAPTSSLSVTAGLGIVVFFTIHILGFRENGLSYLKHFVTPVFIMLPFTLIDEIVRPASLALRLFGNIFGEETVTEELYGIFPIGPPLIMMALSLLFCTIQAVVFVMLTSIYIEESTEPGTRLARLAEKNKT